MQSRLFQTNYINKSYEELCLDKLRNSWDCSMDSCAAGGEMEWKLWWIRKPVFCVKWKTSLKWTWHDCHQFCYFWCRRFLSYLTITAENLWDWTRRTSSSINRAFGVLWWPTGAGASNAIRFVLWVVFALNLLVSQCQTGYHCPSRDT